MFVLLGRLVAMSGPGPAHGSNGQSQRAGLPVVLLDRQSPFGSLPITGGPGEGVEPVAPFAHLEGSIASVPGYPRRAGRPGEGLHPVPGAGPEPVVSVLVAVYLTTLVRGGFQRPTAATGTISPST